MRAYQKRNEFSWTLFNPMMDEGPIEKKRIQLDITTRWMRDLSTKNRVQLDEETNSVGHYNQMDEGPVGMKKHMRWMIKAAVKRLVSLWRAILMKFLKLLLIVHSHSH